MVSLGRMSPKPLPPRRGVVCLALLTLAVISGCDREIIYEDYPVEFDGDPGQSWREQDPLLVPGIYEEQLFSELTAGDGLHIIYGFQGGVWAHISVRVAGAPPSGTLTASLTRSSDGSLIGTTELTLQLVQSPDGYFEGYDIPIPIDARDTELAALDGAQAELFVSFATAERAVEATRAVTLVAP